jgi:hypothetical protein
MASADGRQSDHLAVIRPLDNEQTVDLGIRDEAKCESLPTKVAQSATTGVDDEVLHELFARARFAPT